MHGDMARQGIRHNPRDAQRVNAASSPKVQFGEGFVFKALPSQCRACDDAGSLAQMWRPVDLCRLDRLPSRYKSKLRELVQQPGLFTVKVVLCPVAANFSRIPESQPLTINTLDGRYCRGPSRQHIPKLGSVAAQGGDDAESGDHYTTFRHGRFSVLNRGARSALRKEFFDFAHNVPYGVE